MSQKMRISRALSGAIDWSDATVQRAAFVGAIVCVMFVVAGLRFYKIQVVHHQFLEERNSSSIAHQRGKIVDRDLRLLATNERAYDLYVSLPEDDPERTGQIISSVSRHFPRALKAMEKRRDRGGFVYVDRGVSADKMRLFRSLDLKSTEGGVHRVWRRAYPYGRFAGQMIGFVGTDEHGLEGLEYSYDSLLRGTSEWKAGRQRPLSVRLTIDFDMQRRLEHLLERQVEETGAQSASAVVMEAGSGAVRAAAMVPGFNPSEYAKQPSARRRNRIVTDALEPGSTIKPFVVGWALDQGVLSLDELLWCENGQMPLYDHVINDTEPHGWLSPQQVLEKSSNICTAKIADRLGTQMLYDVFFKVGFGSQIQDDFGGESRGILRKPRNISPVDLATMAFGQGLSVTPLQLTAAYNAFASGGLYRKPYFVDAFLDERLEPVSVKEESAPVRVFSPEVNQSLVHMLHGVVERGTGKKAQLPGVAIAGKTGTAQVPDLVKGGYKEGEYTALFSGFFPADRPLYTVVVFVDNPKSSIYGGQVAAPVFREVARLLAVDLGVLPAIAKRVPSGTSTKRVHQIQANSDQFPDFTGLTMREVLQLAALQKLDVAVEGSGIAVAQTPKGGTELDGRSIHVRFSDRGGDASL